ncbi:MAG: DegV family protein [Oscillospiraceae bacterium]|jgi:DegV family protein with EDD domain|nr:DegV family protein [Oscillospiraceae bacterium]
MDQPKIALVTDSAASLDEAQRRAYDIRVVPLRVIYRQGEYRDGVDITPDQVYARMRSEIPTTSLPLPGDVVALYTELAAAGYTHIIHICISSGLSGTYNMVRAVAAEFPHLTIEVVDSRILSIAQGVLALSCGKLLAEGASFAEAVAHVYTVRKGMLGMFVLRTLEYLRKGGRIGLVEGVMGTVLQLKPIIFVNDDGVYETLAKARGFGNALDTLLQAAKKRFADKLVRVAVVYGDRADEAQALLERAHQTLNTLEGFISQVSPVLGVHTGPSLLGLIVYDAL